MPLFLFIFIFYNIHTGQSSNHIHTIHSPRPLFNSSSLSGSVGKTSLWCRAGNRTRACLPASRRATNWATPHHKTIFTQGQGRGTYSQFLSQFILPRSLFTLWVYTSILEKVTIYPARFTTLFWLVSRLLFTSASLAFAMVEYSNLQYKSTAMQVLKLFTVIKIRAICFWASQGNCWSLIDTVGIKKEVNVYELVSKLYFYIFNIVNQNKFQARVIFYYTNIH